MLYFWWKPIKPQDLIIYPWSSINTVGMLRNMTFSTSLFHLGKLDVKRLNYGNITLLPKTADADRIQQFRPICVLRCIYKLITKTLTLRLDPYASKLFSIHQNAFVKGISWMVLHGVKPAHKSPLKTCLLIKPMSSSVCVLFTCILFYFFFSPLAPLLPLFV
jgi:hypothetical protein